MKLAVHTFAGDIPQGYWKVTSNDKTLAIFDFAIGSIFDKNKNFQILVPSPKFTVDKNYKITKIELKWYRYDYINKKYVEVIDEEVVKKFVDRCVFLITDYDGIDGNSDRIDDSVDAIANWKDIYTTKITNFNQDWYVTGNTDNSKITVEKVMLSVKLSKYLAVNYWYKF